ncbi:TPA: hypothetical protein N0F65_003751 [Lagenidium giganteum]|uniref:HSF-type DNA-binding domain-containing protein n=1 Tax=Lagenidium giganteum TaxID=4803 RepID=A0AAV2YNU3_9STRA|nr:TPA: hypothetical protein N0F65_003751 [Lagenidium giganteum]
MYDLLHNEDPSILAWSDDGLCFHVFDVPRLEAQIRQLNNFGFRKWTKTRANVCTFSHDTLTRCAPPDLPQMLEYHWHAAAQFRASKSSIGLKRTRTPSTKSDSSETSIMEGDFTDAYMVLVDYQALPCTFGGSSDDDEVDDCFMKKHRAAAESSVEADDGFQDQCGWTMGVDELYRLDWSAASVGRSKSTDHGENLGLEPLTVTSCAEEEHSVRIDDWQLDLLIDCLSW